jgi:cytoskeletal protein RodZ
MDETYTPPPKNQKTSEEREADAAFGAESARRLFPLSRGTVIKGALGVASLALIGTVVGQQVQADNEHSAEVASAHASYEHDQNILKEITTEAQAKKIDPANVKDLFGITEGHTLYSLSISAAESQPEYKTADEKTKQWIDFTVGKSAEDQGSYNVGDSFVISSAEIDGKNTLIVQNGQNYQLPDVGASTDAGTIPSPETH